MIIEEEAGDGRRALRVREEGFKGFVGVFSYLETGRVVLAGVLGEEG